MSFERAYASCPQCSPTRSSIFTGWAPDTTDWAQTSLPPWEPTIIHALKERGYFTLMRRPFFLQVGFMDPHRPYRTDAPGGKSGTGTKFRKSSEIRASPHFARSTVSGSPAPASCYRNWSGGVSRRTPCWGSRRDGEMQGRSLLGLSNWMHETYDFLPPPYSDYPARRGPVRTYNMP